MKKEIAVVVAALALAWTAYSAESGAIKLKPSDSPEQIMLKSVQVRPSPQQLAWQQMEYIAFLHFGMNTFTSKEWGNGRESPERFNPTALDARQWARVLKEAGFKEVILTAKHHDGFCLWPSKYTEHSVKSSPWKDGQGDVVREFTDACREYGLKVGIYLSPWDRHEPSYGTPAYNDHYKNQLRELLTNYGEVSEVWFDGAGMGRKWKAMKELYDWQGYFDLVHELQPGAMVFNEQGDVRWCGNEAGRGRESEWSVIPQEYDATAPDLGSRGKILEAAKAGQGIRWLPAEVDTSIRPGWFYHKSQDKMVKSLPHLLDVYFNSVGGNAVLLLNMPPDRRGLINENDVARLNELKKVLDQTFKQNLALGAAAKASSVRGNDKTFAADKTVDNDKNTYWMTDDGVTKANIEYDLGQPATFNLAVLQEEIRQGQRVEAFAVDVWDGSTWREIASATTIGYKRMLRFPEVTAQKLRLRIEHSRICPTISNFELYFSPAGVRP